jgi:hypothetical protein
MDALQHKAQTFWVIALSAIAVSLVWAFAPSIEIAIATEQVVLLDKVMLSGGALVFAALLAAAIGGETDAKIALKKAAVADDAELARYEKAVGRVRLATYAFFSAIVALLIVDRAELGAPLTWIEGHVVSATSPQGFALVAILFSAFCGLAMTFLVIDSYLAPLTEQVAKMQSQALSAKQLSDEVNETALDFFEAARTILRQNVPALSGTSRVGETLERITLRFHTGLKASSLLPLPEQTKQAVADAIANLSDSTSRLKEAMRFLSEYRANDNRSGSRLFRRALDGIGEPSDQALAALASLHAAIKLQIPADVQTRLSDVVNDMVAAWDKLMLVATQHYGVTDQAETGS